MTSAWSKSQIQIYCISLVLAPALFAVSTFYWEHGAYGITGGTILNLSFIFWVPALNAMFGLLRESMPRYSAWGFFIAVFGCLIGSNFGLADVYSGVFNIPHQDYLAAWSKYPLHSNLLLFATGPIFPISLAVLAVHLYRTQVMPGWATLAMGLGALLFPVSRILRNELLAHAVDLLLFVPMAFLSIKLSATAGLRIKTAGNKSH